MIMTQLKNKIAIFISDFRYNWLVWRIKGVYRFVRNFFSPRQSWVIKGMYYDWYDKPELIREVLFRCIVHFVEKEKCFEVVEWEFTSEHKECSTFIEHCYDWITFRRPKLVTEIDKIIEGGLNISLTDRPTLSYDEIYPGLIKLEKELEENDNRYLTGILKWRRYLWT